MQERWKERMLYFNFDKEKNWNMTFKKILENIFTWKIIEFNYPQETK